MPIDQKMQKILSTPFPATKVKKKPGPGGRSLDYISHGLITERLNGADPDWSWDVVTEHIYYDEQKRPHCAGVTIRLTVGGVTRIEAGGPQRQETLANELKNAYSDALKRGAMRFGVALSVWENLIDAVGDEDVYPDDDGAGRQAKVAHGNGEPYRSPLAQPTSNEPPRTVVKATSPDVGAEEKPKTKGKPTPIITPLGNLHGLAKKRGIQGEGKDVHTPLRSVCQYLLPRVPAKDGSGYVALTSMEQLSDGNLEYLYKRIEDADEKSLMLMAVDYPAAIKRAQTVADLRRIWKDLASIGATEHTHPDLLKACEARKAALEAKPNTNAA